MCVTRTASDMHIFFHSSKHHRIITVFWRKNCAVPKPPADAKPLSCAARVSLCLAVSRRYQLLYSLLVRALGVVGPPTCLLAVGEQITSCSIAAGPVLSRATLTTCRVR